MKKELDLAKKKQEQQIAKLFKKIDEWRAERAARYKRQQKQMEKLFSEHRELNVNSIHYLTQYRQQLIENKDKSSKAE